MTKKKTFTELINGKQPLLIDFHATWCGPCKMLAPTVKTIAKEMAGQLKVIKVDVDKNQALSTRLEIRGVPTLMLYKEGEMVWRQSGVLTAHQIKEAVGPFL